MSRGEPLIRQWNLMKALQTHRFGVCADELAVRLECSKRQVQRDLNILQEAGFPISFEQRDFGKKFWKLSPMFIERQEFVLSVTEMLSLFLGRQLLAPLSGTQFGDGLITALNKIKALLPAQALKYFDSLDDSVLVKSLAQHDYSGQAKEISIINQAMDESRTLKLRYYAVSEGLEIETILHPYGLVVFGTNLYCIGHLEMYGEVRTLKVSRIKGVEMTAARFQKPSTFSLKAYTAGAFGMFSSGKLQKITIRFTGWAATNVRELQWHSSQRIIQDSPDSSGGMIVAKFELTNTTEFKRWLLGFGRHAIVVSPASLRADVREELQANLVAYSMS